MLLTFCCGDMNYQCDGSPFRSSADCFRLPGLCEGINCFEAVKRSLVLPSSASFAVHSPTLVPRFNQPWSAEEPEAEISASATSGVKGTARWKSLFWTCCWEQSIANNGHLCVFVFCTFRSSGITGVHGAQVERVSHQLAGKLWPDTGETASMRQGIHWFILHHFSVTGLGETIFA